MSCLLQYIEEPEKEYGCDKHKNCEFCGFNSEEHERRLALGLVHGHYITSRCPSIGDGYELRRLTNKAGEAYSVIIHTSTGTEVASSPLDMEKNLLKWWTEKGKELWS